MTLRGEAGKLIGLSDVRAGVVSKKSMVRAAAGRFRRRLLAVIAGARSTTGSGSIALTYDDGPHPIFTPLLLDVLRDGGARATFFVVGVKAERHPEIVRRIVDEGHSLGSHSMNHLDFRGARVTAASRDIDEGRRKLEEIVGRPVSLFRPPHGHLTLQTAALLRFKGCKTWLWDTDSYDWKSDLTPDDIRARAALAKPGGVILMHDDRQRTLEATALLTAQFAKEGIRLAPLRGWGGVRRRFG